MRAMAETVQVFNTCFLGTIELNSRNAQLCISVPVVMALLYLFG